MNTLLLLTLLALSGEQNPVCKQRGHVSTGVFMITAAYYPDQIVDLPGRTLRISWDGNSRTTICSRCGEGFSLPPDKPDTTIVWQKEEPDSVLMSKEQIAAIDKAMIQPYLIDHQEVKMIEPKDSNIQAVTNATFNIWGGTRLGCEFYNRFGSPHETALGAYGDVKLNLSKDLALGFRVVLPFAMDAVNYRITLDKKLF